ncbi:hypothetical protein O181_080244 [Austropuccinia psidii MF-1]|uniref:DNL-type domain-containing protein n=1 Tax=Austropuccinia psidii MF-1 TaxID=1389203 RepID=A0A9Q3FKI3_9BASI|nr:hypothetical protein [Austropuccinia psidii MF-1]
MLINKFSMKFSKSIRLFQNLTKSQHFPSGRFVKSAYNSLGSSKNQTLFSINSCFDSRILSSKSIFNLRHYSDSINSKKNLVSYQKPRMRIQFTCTASTNQNQNSNHQCGHRNDHEFSSHAYHHGIVIVQCPACLNRHLIADHLQWFTSNKTSNDPNFFNDHKTIVDLMKSKGQNVKRGKINQEGKILEFFND